jgi:ferric-dicitrate binding protein FerR (iron transport regulator)
MTSTELGSQLEYWTAVCCRPWLDPAELNALPQWLAEDECRVSLLAQACARIPLSAREALYGDLDYSAKVRLLIRLRRMRLHWTARRRLKNHSTQQRAEFYLRSALGMPWAEQVADALRADLAKRDRPLHNEFARLYYLWCDVLSTRRDNLCAGFFDAPLPPIASLTADLIERLAAAEGERAYILRHLHTHRVGGWCRLTASNAAPAHHKDAYGHRFLLSPDAILQVRINPALRELAVLRGTALVNLGSTLGWACELCINQQRVRFRGYSFLVHRAAPDTVTLEVVAGTVEIFQAGQAPLRFYDDDVVSITPQGVEPCQSTGLSVGDLIKFDMAISTAQVQKLRSPDDPPLPPSSADSALMGMRREVYTVAVLNDMREWLQETPAHVICMRSSFMQMTHDFAQEPPEQTPFNAAQFARTQRLLSSSTTQFLTGEAVRALTAEQRALAFSWLCQVDQQPSSGEVLDADVFLEAQPLLYVAYHQLRIYWEALRAHQLHKLLAGMRCEPLPELSSLQPEQLSALAAAEQDIAIELRRAQLRDRLGCTELSTPIAQRANHELASGDELSLNAASQVRVCIGSRERRIDLLQGELRLEMHGALAWPLEIQVNQLRVRTDARIFNINRLNERSVDIYVLSGVLQISALDGATLPGLAPHTHIVLKRRQRLQIDGERLQFTELELDEIATLSGWLKGYGVFMHMPLRDVVSICNRYRTVPLVVSDPELAAVTVDGGCQIGDEPQLLEFLAEHDIYAKHAEAANQPVLQLYANP